MLMVTRARPAAFHSRSARRVRSEALVIIAISTPVAARMPAMIAVSSGWSVGSPPVRRIFRTPSDSPMRATRMISLVERSDSRGAKRTSGSMQ
jgi:hypothetical protein